MATIGEVNFKIKSEVKSEHEIEWKIYNFSSLSDQKSVCYPSPSFLFCKESWYLRIYPNGIGITPTEYISLYLRTKSCVSPIKIEYSLGLKELSGQKFKQKYCEYTFTKAEEGHGCSKLLLRSEIFKKTADLLPNDAITVFCSLTYPTSVETPIKAALNEKCSLCEKIVDTDNLSLHQKKDKPVKCPDCSAVITLKNWCDHECQAQKSDCEDLNYRSLSDDLKKVLLGGCNHDLILKVGDKELKAHQDILSARSEVFKRMLKYDMTEKNSGIIDIPDCDPDAMKVFLSYIYCGKVENLDQSNAIGLYYIADKYDMKILKENSSDFIKKSVSSINICEVIQLALNHSDSSLLDFATEFFLNNVLEILRTVEWQHFMKNNLTVANELMIKSHEKKK